MQKYLRLSFYSQGNGLKNEVHRNSDKDTENPNETKTGGATE